MCGQRARNERRSCDRFHRTSIPSGPTQSPTSEGPSQEFVENGKCEITDRGTVPDRASLRICELAKLKAHVDLLEESGQLKLAIDTNDLDTVKTLMTRNPALHRSPLGYAKNGPLTWVAECRVPWGPPSPARLAMAEWMIDHGSDVHQGGDGPLMRATLGDRIAMMELLVSRGADVNALWNGHYPILFGACEVVDPASLKWLLEHGADPNCPKLGQRTTAIDYLIGTYTRSPDLRECLELLLGAGGTTKYNVPCFLDLLRGRLDRVAEQLDAAPDLVHRRFTSTRQRSERSSCHLPPIHGSRPATERDKRLC